MAQTQEGAIKIAANKIGISESEYIKRYSNGEKWCFRCKAWHPQTEFGVDNSRWDSLAASCRKSKNGFSRDQYIPKPPPLSGRSFVPARAGDKKQARRRINYFVEAGLLLHPNSHPCVDCGHEWKEGERRHEYDHFKGYAPEHHETVESVCTLCHSQREMTRREKEKWPENQT